MSGKWVLAVLVDESAKVHSTVGGASVPEAFRRGWKALKEKMSEENPPALTLTISSELRIAHTFGSGHVIARESDTKQFEATHLTREVTYTKCVCEICGWDEAAKHTTRLAVTDAFGLRDLIADIESLVSEESATFIAPHPQIKVECPMCEALREKGIDPKTLQPSFRETN
jgi:hypothetical protein